MKERKHFKKIVVIERGKVANRILKACKELGIYTIAVYSEHDVHSSHHLKADKAYVIGKGRKPFQACFDIEEMIEIAKHEQADAIHPGYGIWMENLKLSKRCREEDIVFIGPRPTHIELFNDKAAARATAATLGIPLVPDTPTLVQSIQEAITFGEETGYLIIIKTTTGYKEKSIQVVRSKEELLEIAEHPYSGSKMYVTKYLERPKHITIQVLADRYGEFTYFLGEESSYLLLSTTLIHQMGQSAIRLMKAIDCHHIGIIEFLVTPDCRYYFSEINTRVQFASRRKSGVDIIRSQIRLAEGFPLVSMDGNPSVKTVL